MSMGLNGSRDITRSSHIPKTGISMYFISFNAIYPIISMVVVLSYSTFDGSTEGQGIL
jgi:hypothetical protein